MASAGQEQHILCAEWNQDHTHLALGTRRGWRIYANEPFQMCHSVALPNAGVGAIQMLFSSSLIALVGCGERAGDSPRRLRLWNTAASEAVFELTFESTVLAVRMNRSRLLVVLEEATHVFELQTMRLLHTVETAPNPLGLAALSVVTEPSYAAVAPPPRAPAPGHVLLYNAKMGLALSTVAAHTSPVVCLALSTAGDLLATASEKGTVVRVHSVPAGELLHVFRRGSIRATIHSLSFSAAAEGLDDGGAEAADGSVRPVEPGGGYLLCAASSTGTVHVWRLDTQTGSSSAGGGRGRFSAPSGYTPRLLASWVTSTLGTAAGYTQQSISPYASAERDVASVRVKLQPGARWCRAVLRESARDGYGPSGGHSLIVLTDAGAWMLYRLDALTGACTLQDERRLLTV